MLLLQDLNSGGILLCRKIQINVHDIFTNYVQHSQSCLALQKHKLQEYEIFLLIFFIPTFSCSDPLPASPFTPFCFVSLPRSDCNDGKQWVLVPVTQGQKASQVGQVLWASLGQCDAHSSNVILGSAEHNSLDSHQKPGYGSWACGCMVGTSSREECLERQLHTLMSVSTVFYGNKLPKLNPTANG